MKFISLLIFFLLISNKAFAYLDPGSVSILMQAILFIVAGFITFFGLLKLRIKSIYQKVFKKKKKDLD